MSGELPDPALRRLLADAEELLQERPAPVLLRGRYRLLRELGRGGMGVVWEAEDTELRRRVALKVLKEPLQGDRDARRRFVREAQSVARLGHPHIAAVYDADEHMLAMQLIDGIPLSRAPRGSVRETVALLRDAARAVQHAHERGIVHRDLKPANLMLENGHLWVTDFGLAKETSVESSLSLSGGLLGTPAYMAPEQAAGRNDLVDARTDVYGLGATLFDRLAGRPPFVDQDLGRLLRRIVEEQPPALAGLQRGLPRDLDTVVRKCLRKEPELRYPTAGELADDLDRWLAGQPVLARPPSLRYRAQKFVQRRRAVVSVAAAGALALAISLLILQAETAGRRGAEQALALSEFVNTVLEDAERSIHRDGDISTMRTRLEEGLARCDEFLARRDVGHVHYLKARLLQALQRDAGAIAELDRALAAGEDLPEARLWRGILRAEALFAVLSREFPGRTAADPDLPAELARPRAAALDDLALLEDPAAQRHLTETSLLRALAGRCRLQGERARARRLLEELRQRERSSATARLGLSQLELEEGNAEAAWHLAMSAVDIYRGFGPAYLNPRPPDGAHAAPAGMVERAVRQHQLSDAERSVETRGATPDNLRLRGLARYQLDDVEGALADFTELLRTDPGDAAAHGARGLVHARRAARLAREGQHGPALQSWQAAIEDYQSALLIEPALAGAHNNRGVAHSECAHLYLLLGDRSAAAAARSAARTDFDRALELAPHFGLARFNRAQQGRRQAVESSAAGRWDEARALLLAALADLDANLARAPDDALSLGERARVARALGQLDHLAGDDTSAARWRDRALQDLDRAVALDPGDARAAAEREHLRSGGQD